MLTASFAAVLDEVRGISWPALRRVRSAVVGPHASIVRGTMAEFVEHRAYQQGDDPKKIDWKLVARTDRVYIRLSQERAILPTMLVVDGSASMAFPPTSLAKWDLASRLAIGLAAVARHGGDSVGLVVVHAGGRNLVMPRTRRTVLDEMMRALDVAPAGEAPLAPAAVQSMRQSARVVLVSDFLGDADALLAAGRPFVAAGGELHAIHIADAGELEPDPKTLLLVDPEQSTMRRPMTPAARAVYLQRFAAWRSELARQWRNAGATYTMLVPAAEPLRRAVRRITTPARARRVRG